MNLSDDEKVIRLQMRWEDGAGDMRVFESLLVQVIDSGAWKSFRTPNGVPVQPESFRKFVADRPPFGLGTTPEKIYRVIGDDNDAVVKMRDLLKEKAGRPANNDDKSDNIVMELNKQGNSRAYTLDRLTRERPDLRQRVDNGELSANAAAIEAGFRPVTFTVRADNPQSIANTLRRRLTPDVLDQVRAQLNERVDKTND